MDWQLSLSGLLIGGLVGLTGMGGGSLMTPLLVIVFGFSPSVAIGTDLAHGAIFKSAGAIRHRRLGTVHARLSGWMFLGSAPFSILGVWLATRITATYGDGAQSVMAPSSRARSSSARSVSQPRASSATTSTATRRSCSAGATASPRSRSGASAG